MGQLSAAPFLSLFQKADLKAKYYVFCFSYLYSEYGTVFTKQKKNYKRQTVHQETQEPWSTQQPPLRSPLRAHPFHPSSEPEYWGVTSILDSSIYHLLL